MKFLRLLAEALSAASFWVVALPFLGVVCITVGAGMLVSLGAALVVLGAFLIMAGLLVARALRLTND